MKATLGELSEKVGGTLHGDGGIVITGAATLTDSGPGDITFVSKPRHLRKLASAAAVVVPADLTPEGIAYVTVDDAVRAFTDLVRLFRPPRQRASVGISPQAFVSPTAVCGADVQIHAGATIGDDVRIGGRTVIHSGVRLDPGCRIGADVTIYSNAVLYEGTVVGERTMIHAGAVLGAYGFGYDSTSRGHRLCPQLGNVEIGCDVEIGACTTIDRGTFGPTRIGDGTKIDNLVMIAHNCQIGRHNMLCAQVGLAGSCVTGDFVVMAGQVGVRDHLRIGDQATIGAKSGVMGHVKPKTTVVGLPATDIREQMNRQASWARMPDLREQVQKQEQVIRELLERIEQLENARPKLYEPDESPADEAARRAA